MTERFVSNGGGVWAAGPMQATDFGHQAANECGYLIQHIDALHRAMQNRF